MSWFVPYTESENHWTDRMLNLHLERLVVWFACWTIIFWPRIARQTNEYSGHEWPHADMRHVAGGIADHDDDRIVSRCKSSGNHYVDLQDAD